MSPRPDHKPITEAERMARCLDELAGEEEGAVSRWHRAGVCVGTALRAGAAAIREACRFREALVAISDVAVIAATDFDTAQQEHVHDMHVLASKALGHDEPCGNPSCDGVKDDPNYPGDGPDGMIHRCFKDGRWLDDGSEM